MIQHSIGLWIPDYMVRNLNCKTLNGNHFGCHFEFTIWILILYSKGIWKPIKCVWYLDHGWIPDSKKMVFSCWVYRSLFVLTHVLFQIREMMGDPLLSNYTVIILVNGLVFMFLAVTNELAFSNLIVLAHSGKAKTRHPITGLFQVTRLQISLTSENQLGRFPDSISDTIW